MMLMWARCWGVFVVCLLLSGVVVAQDQPAEDPHQAFLKGLGTVENLPASPDLSETGEQVFGLANKFRLAEKKSKLVVNEQLKAASHKFAEFMAENSKFGHEVDDRNFLDRAKAEGYAPCLALENIAFTYSTKAFSTKSLAEELMESWKKSPGHRENLLDADVTETGIGVARSSKTGVYYAVQLFGRPLTATREFKVKNDTTSEVTYKVGEQQFKLLPRIVNTHKFCRSPKVTFTSVGENDPKRVVTPGADERYVIQAVDGAVTVKLETVKESEGVGKPE